MSAFRLRLLAATVALALAGTLAAAFPPRNVCPFHPGTGMTEAASWCESEFGVTGHG
jgi:hypothetical protein